LSTNRLATVRTLAIISGRTRSGRDSARETVATETPATRATSTIVAAPCVVDGARFGKRLPTGMARWSHALKRLGKVSHSVALRQAGGAANA
jgi:hypothetical protein